MKITMTAGRSSENGGRFSGGYFAGGHDGMANLCKQIMAYDFHVRYNNIDWQHSYLRLNTTYRLADDNNNNDNNDDNNNDNDNNK